MFAIFPEILNQTQAGDIEAVSCLVRKYFADGQVFTPNLRVADLCANAEIKLRTNAQNLAARMEAWDANGQYRIEISLHPDIKNQREWNYILALMLGHVFLDLQPKMAKGELQRSIFEKKQSPLRELLLSPEGATPADMFAAALLLPKAMVKKAMGSLSSRKDVAAFFNVDLQLLDFRLSALGLLTGAKKASAEPALRQSENIKEPTSRTKESSSHDSEKKSRGDSSPKLDGAEPKAPGHGSKPKEQLQNANQSSKQQTPSLNPSSLARVNRNTAARSYKTEGEKDPVSENKREPRSSEASQAPSPGLERLRQLARKIDKSVSD